MENSQDIRALEVILTAGCNLRCSYCYQNDKKARSMPWETLRASLDLLCRHGGEDVSVLFIGGEPLLEFPLIERAVDYLEEKRPRRMNLRYAVITNGTLFAERHADFFATHDFNVQLSFDGVATMQNLRGSGTFHVLDALLGHLHRTRYEFFRRKLRVGMTLLAQTIPWFPESVAYFLQKGVQDIRVSPAITAQPDWRVNRIDELDRGFEAVFHSSLIHLRRTGEVPFVAFRTGEEAMPPSAADEVPMCAVANAAKIAVDANGQVLGCVTFADSYQTFPTTFLRSRMEALRMGKLGDPELNDKIADYPSAVRATGMFHDKRTKYSSYGRCVECRFLNTCHFCPVSIGHQPGNSDPDRVPDFLCAYNLVSQKYRERFPKMAAADDILLGRAPIPDLARELFSVSHEPPTLDR